MAKFFNPNYHEDTIEKHKLTKEEKEFLRDLQKELNTQDEMSQANPRYWGIMGKERIYRIESDEADGYELYNTDCCETIGDDIESIVEYLNESILPIYNEDNNSTFVAIVSNDSLFYDSIILTNGKEDENIILESKNELEEWLNKNGYDEYTTISYVEKDKIYENAIFLTYKDAEIHLRNNAHHYDENAHPYAMTAWRNPNMDKLIKILQTVDFN